MGIAEKVPWRREASAFVTLVLLVLSSCWLGSCLPSPVVRYGGKKNTGQFEDCSRIPFFENSYTAALLQHVAGNRKPQRILLLCVALEVKHAASSLRPLPRQLSNVWVPVDVCNLKIKQWVIKDAVMDAEPFSNKDTLADVKKKKCAASASLSKKRISNRPTLKWLSCFNPK